MENKRNRREKTMHHHTGSSPIIYTMEELRIQGEELPIIKGFEKTYVRAGDEAIIKHYISVFCFTILLFDAYTYEVYYTKYKVY